MPAGPEFWSRLLRAIAIGLPLWITVILAGALLFSVFAADFRGRTEAHSRTDVLATRPGRTVDTTRVVALGSLITLMLYPVALRVSNALNFGIDYPIVSRYSMPFASVIVLLVLCMVRQRRIRVLLASVGVIGLLASIGL